MLRKLKWQIPGEPLAAQYNWCQGPVPGCGPAVEKHCYKANKTTTDFRHAGLRILYGRPDPQWSLRYSNCHICRKLSILVLKEHMFN